MGYCLLPNVGNWVQHSCRGSSDHSNALKGAAMCEK